LDLPDFIPGFSGSKLWSFSPCRVERKDRKLQAELQTQ
jgi:hypothetical protein